MSEDNNLLSFLKKQSLFNHESPRQAHRRRSSRSKSRGRNQLDSRNIVQQQAVHDPIPVRPLENPAVRYSLPQEVHVDKGRSYSPVNSVSALLNPQPAPVQAATPPTRSVQFQDRVVERPVESNARDFISSIMSYASTFESARVESIQCLDSISGKLSNELHSINSRIDAFNQRMHHTIQQEFKAVKERIYRVIEESFAESERHVREYMLQEEHRLAGDLLAMREELKKQNVKIEGMRNEIGGEHWRKVAGEIIASEIEEKIDALMRKSAGLEVGRWEVGDLVGYRVKDIEKSVQEMVRLGKDR